MFASNYCLLQLLIMIVIDTNTKLYDIHLPFEDVYTYPMGPLLPTTAARNFPVLSDAIEYQFAEGADVWVHVEPPIVIIFIIHDYENRYDTVI